MRPQLFQGAMRRLMPVAIVLAALTAGPSTSHAADHLRMVDASPKPGEVCHERSVNGETARVIDPRKFVNWVLLNRAIPFNLVEAKIDGEWIASHATKVDALLAGKGDLACAADGHCRPDAAGKALRGARAYIATFLARLPRR